MSENNVMEYVLGFLFNRGMDSVVLIEKQRPEWQKQKLNGIGGKIEPEDESCYQAMCREFKEETGAFVCLWEKFSEMKGQNWTVHCFYSVTDDIYQVSTITDETVRIVSIQDLDSYDLLPNIKWLINLCLDPDEKFAAITYS